MLVDPTSTTNRVHDGQEPSPPPNKTSVALHSIANRIPSPSGDEEILCRPHSPSVVTTTEIENDIASMSSDRAVAKGRSTTGDSLPPSPTTTTATQSHLRKDSDTMIQCEESENDSLSQHFDHQGDPDESSDSGNNHDHGNAESDTQERHTKKRRVRHFISPIQSNVLLSVFEQNRFPTRSVHMELANELGLPLKSVQIWFQNRRQLDKSDRIGEGSRDRHRVSRYSHSMEFPHHSYFATHRVSHRMESQDAAIDRPRFGSLDDTYDPVVDTERMGASRRRFSLNSSSLPQRHSSPSAHHSLHGLSSWHFSSASRHSHRSTPYARNLKSLSGLPARGRVRHSHEAAPGSPVAQDLQQQNTRGSYQERNHNASYSVSSPQLESDHPIPHPYEQSVILVCCCGRHSVVEPHELSMSLDHLQDRKYSFDRQQSPSISYRHHSHSPHRQATRHHRSSPYNHHQPLQSSSSSPIHLAPIGSVPHASNTQCECATCFSTRPTTSSSISPQIPSSIVAVTSAEDIAPVAPIPHYYNTTSHSPQPISVSSEPSSQSLPLPLSTTFQPRHDYHKSLPPWLPQPSEQSSPPPLDAGHSAPTTLSTEHHHHHQRPLPHYPLQDSSSTPSHVAISSDQTSSHPDWDADNRRHTH